MTAEGREAAYRDRFPPRWIPSTFQILPEPFTVHNRMLNSTMKAVRHKIVKAYRQLLEYM